MKTHLKQFPNCLQLPQSILVIMTYLHTESEEDRAYRSLLELILYYIVT